MGSGGMFAAPQDPNLVETTFSSSSETKPCQVRVQLDEPLHGHKEGDKGIWIGQGTDELGLSTQSLQRSS